MKIYRLRPLSFCDTNSYFVASEKNNCVLIDAPAEADYILDMADVYGLTLKKIFLTHGHFDHVGAVADLVEKTGCEVYIHENDLEKLTKGDGLIDNGFFEGGLKRVSSAKTFTEDDVLTLDELEFDVVHTPGHTSGSVCFIVGSNMFSGDTLFSRSVGRTDMADGNYKDMLKSLEKIYDLGGDLAVYPGHMEVTTLETEKRYNPYLRNIGDKR
ncbi:MAG: MBL fold metallo-hydrolase [Ruminococcus sp.]|nr:MBL fold metallo-hydrolase [Ruminococcus sp.]